MPTDFLESQIRLYEQQSGKVEAETQDHLEPMHCRNLEDLIGFGLLTLERIMRHNGQWSDDVRSGGAEFTWDDSERFAKAYKIWLRSTRQIIESAARCQERGCELDGVDELRSAFKDISLMSLDTERLKSSVESLQQGRGIPHAQAMNELRDSLRQTRIRRPA